MGCSVPNIVYIFILKCPLTSLSIILQRWGRSGRDRLTKAVCVLLVPSWALRPPLPLSLPALDRVKGKKTIGEPKQNLVRREKLDADLEKFINAGHGNPQGMYRVHLFLIAKHGLTASLYL